MLFIVVGCVVGAVAAFSIYREPRRFRNSVYLLTALLFLLFGLMIESNQVPLFNGIALLAVFAVTPLSLGLAAVLLMVNGVVMVKKEGRRPKNLLSFGVGLLMLLSMAGIVVLAVWGYGKLSFLQSGLLILWGMLCCYVGFTFLAFLLYSLLYSRLPKRAACDYIVVHGAGLLGGSRVSPLLAGRLQKGIEVYEKGGRTAKLVVSGGQGGDETVSEAAAMRGYLLEQGIPAEDILLEDASLNTFQNLQYCKKLFDQRGYGKPYTCIFVTSNYHVFRTSLYARKLGLDAQGVGSRTARYYWPSAFIREYIAVMKQFYWGFLIVLGVWFFLFGISVF